MFWNVVIRIAVPGCLMVFAFFFKFPSFQNLNIPIISESIFKCLTYCSEGYTKSRPTVGFLTHIGYMLVLPSSLRFLENIENCRKTSWMSFFNKYFFLLLIFHFYIINYLLSFVSDGYVKIGKQFGWIKNF